MKVSEVGYLAEGVSKKWAKAIRACQSRDALLAVCEAWSELCPDALEAARAEGFDFEDFDRARKLEARGKYSGDESAAKYGAILLPGRLLQAQTIVAQFHVPEGVAIRRLADAGWPAPPKLV